MARTKDLAVEIAVIHERLEGNNRRRMSERESDLRAIDKAEQAAAAALREAKSEADERLRSHNGLIEQMRALSGTFATRVEVERLTSWQAKVTGGLIVVSAIGLANFIKVWT